VFPLVVGPRYIPGEKLARADVGKGGKHDTDRVPDASRISPPVLGKGRRSGHDVSIVVEADAGLPIAEWKAAAHEVVASHDGAKLRVELAKKDELANRDFVLRWRTKSAKPQSVLWLGPTDGDGKGHFQLLVQPPQIDVDREVGRREIVFVVDVSGSMSGPPLGLAKGVVRALVGQLRPVDTFDMVTFESGTDRLFAAPQPANEARIAEALVMLDGLSAGGGTEMADAVDEALRGEVAPGRHRYVVFVTDGYIGNEGEIFSGAKRLVRRLADRGQVARVFAIGIGSAPNRHLLDGLARSGDGLAVDVVGREDTGPTVNAVQRWIDSAVLREIEVDWGGLDVEGVAPADLPDLFASHSLVVHGQYSGKATGEIVVRGAAGKRRGHDVVIPVAVAHANEKDRTLRTLWARAQIADLEALSWSGENVEDRITDLGLRFRLVTAYTSLVAIDRDRVVGDGAPDLVVQPVEVPEGVDGDMAGATYYEDELVDVAPTPNASSPEPAMDMDEAPALSSRRSRSYAVQRKSLHRDREYERDTREPRSVLSLEGIGKRGGLAEAAIKRIFRATRRELQRCVEGEGSATFVVEIALRDGAPPIVTVHEGIVGAGARSCVEEALAGARWPEVEQRTVIELELRLELR
jgi:Ca-activated chloride channel family protein